MWPRRTVRRSRPRATQLPKFRHADNELLYRHPSGCPNNVSDLGFVYGYQAPPAPPYNGTIVMFSGDGGEDAAIRSNFHTYVTYYLQNGYQIVEVAWGPPSGGIAW